MYCRHIIICGIAVFPDLSVIVIYKFNLSWIDPSSSQKHKVFHYIATLENIFFFVLS